MGLSLATIGFVTTGIFFGIYAYTFYLLAGKKLQASLKSFAYAYFSLSLAFLIWGVVAFIGDQNLLNLSVIAGNILLLLSTVFLLNLHFENNKVITTVVSVLFSLVFIWWRITYFPPQPLITNGILVFGTQLPVAIILGLILLTIWLPTNIKVANLVAEKLKIKGMSFIYSSIYIMATIASLLFISARTIPVIILSFVGITLCFAMLIASNIIIDKVTGEKNGRN